MPVVRITYPRGALTRAQKAQLAAELTEIALDAEVDAVTEAGRMVTVVQFQEAAAEDWAVGGVMRADAASPPDHFIVELIVLDGLLEGERRSNAHRRVTEAFTRALPGNPMLALRVWVLIHEVREGSWGAAGRTVSALDVAQFLAPRLDPAVKAQIARAIEARKDR